MSSIRHFRGEIGETLKRRAGKFLSANIENEVSMQLHTFLIYCRSVDFNKSLVGVFILLTVVHLALSLPQS